MGNASSSEIPNIPPAPGGSRTPTWASATRQGFQDGADGKPANPPKNRDLAEAYMRGYRNGQVVAQQAEARARSWTHALGLDEASKAYRRARDRAGPPPATAPVRLGWAKGAR